MLTLIQGGFYAAPENEIFAAVQNRIHAKRDTILLVPEQQTLSKERAAAGSLPADAPLYFEVTNFTRLANRVFRTIGGLGEDYSDACAKSLIMWQTLTELSAVLSPAYARVSEGSVEKALGALAQLRRFALSPADLQEAADALGGTHPRLREKLTDMAQIGALYARLHAQRYTDSAQDVGRMCGKLRENSDLFSGTHFFVEGFTSFTADQSEVLSVLMRRCAVHVVLTIPQGAEDDPAYAEVIHARRHLIALAAKADVPCKIQKISENRAVKSEILRAVLPRLWQFNTKIDRETLQNADNSLRIFRGVTPYEEADFIVSDILRRVQEEGAHFSDFAIVANRVEPYEGILDAAMRRAGIPTFFSVRRQVSTLEGVKLIFAAYDAVLGGFRRDELILYMKCLPGGDRADCDLFERYTERWQIDGTRFTDGILWNMNPDGITTVHAPDEADILLRVNAVREQICARLCPFSEDMRAAKTVRRQAEALFSFLSSLSLEERLGARAKQLAALGEGQAARENAALWKILCDASDRLVDLMGDFPADARVFVSLLHIALGSADIGHLPAVLDEVTVGAASMLRVSGKRHVYLLGVNAGEFPAAPAQDAFLSLADREVLLGVGVDTDPDRDVRGGRELFAFCRAFAAGSESVTLLYAEKDASFHPLQSAALIARIEEMTEARVHPVAIGSLPPEARLSTPTAALCALFNLRGSAHAAVRDALDTAGFSAMLSVADSDLCNRSLHLCPETARDLYGEQMALTQSRIDKYVSCPLSHFCVYALRLDEARTAQFDRANIGSFIHAILENFFCEVRASGKSPAQLSEQTRDEMVDRHARAYLTELQQQGTANVRTRQMLSRLIRTTQQVVHSLCEEFRRCSFSPAFFELSIRRGEEGVPSPVCFPLPDGSEVFVFGVIDRVDTYRKGDDVYVRVIDYKTGNKDFSPDDLQKGQNLQMFLYMESLMRSQDAAFRKRIGVSENGKIIPAGVIYVKTALRAKPLPSPGADARQQLAAEQGRRGMILCDPVALAAQDPDFLPIRMKRDGTPDARSQNRLYTEEGWDALFDTVRESVCAVASRMKSGDICASPIRVGSHASVCESCRFRPICRGVAQLSDNDTPTEHSFPDTPEE